MIVTPHDACETALSVVYLFYQHTTTASTNLDKTNDNYENEN